MSLIPEFQIRSHIDAALAALRVGLESDDYRERNASACRLLSACFDLAGVKMMGGEALEEIEDREAEEDAE